MVQQIRRFAKIQVASFTKEAIWPFGNKLQRQQAEELEVKISNIEKALARLTQQLQKQQFSPKKKEEVIQKIRSMKERLKDLKEIQDPTRRVDLDLTNEEKQVHQKKHQREELAREAEKRKQARRLKDIVLKAIPKMKKDLDYLYNVFIMNLERLKSRKSIWDTHQPKINKIQEQYDELEYKARKLQQQGRPDFQNEFLPKLEELESKLEAAIKERDSKYQSTEWPKDIEPILQSLQEALFSLDTLSEYIDDEARQPLHQIIYGFLEPLFDTFVQIHQMNEHELQDATSDFDLEPFVNWVLLRMNEDNHPKHRKQKEPFEQIDFDQFDAHIEPYSFDNLVDSLKRYL